MSPARRGTAVTSIPARPRWRGRRSPPDRSVGRSRGQSGEHVTRRGRPDEGCPDLFGSPGRGGAKRACAALSGEAWRTRRRIGTRSRVAQRCLIGQTKLRAAMQKVAAGALRRIAPPPRIRWEHRVEKPQLATWLESTGHGQSPTCSDPSQISGDNSCRRGLRAHIARFAPLGHVRSERMRCSPERRKTSPTGHRYTKPVESAQHKAKKAHARQQQETGRV